MCLVYATYSKTNILLIASESSTGTDGIALAKKSGGIFTLGIFDGTGCFQCSRAQEDSVTEGEGF